MTQANSDKIVTLNTFFPTSRTTIWNFWTVPALLKKWFGSDPEGTVISAYSALREGGNFSVTFQNANGTEHTCAGTYLVVVPCERLEFTWFWKGREAHVEFISVALSDVSNGVAMTFVQSNIDPDTTHSYAQGWSSTFDKLRKALVLETDLV